MTRVRGHRRRVAVFASERLVALGADGYVSGAARHLKQGGVGPHHVEVGIHDAHTIRRQGEDLDRVRRRRH